MIAGGPRRGRAVRARGAIVALTLCAVLAAPGDGSAGTAPLAKKKSKTSAKARSASGRRQAPEIDASRWLNGPPLRAADLDGEPRLVAFWTFGCENCKRTVPALREIQFLYAKRGLVLIGVHTPEFPRERDSTAVAAAAKDLGLTFPIALDNEHVVWKAFKNRYWPALYLIDRAGTIRSSHIGELHVKTRAWTNFTASIEEVLAEKP